MISSSHSRPFLTCVGVQVCWKTAELPQGPVQLFYDQLHSEQTVILFTPWLHFKHPYGSFVQEPPQLTRRRVHAEWKFSTWSVLVVCTNTCCKLLTALLKSNQWLPHPSFCAWRPILSFCLPVLMNWDLGINVLLMKTWLRLNLPFNLNTPFESM